MEKTSEKTQKDNAMNELGQALKVLLERLFNFLDLSFFISGITTLSALIVVAHIMGLHPERLMVDNTLWLIGVAIASYVSGLLSFAMGRELRRFLKLCVASRQETTSSEPCQIIPKNINFIVDACQAAKLNRLPGLIKKHGLSNNQKYENLLSCLDKEKLDSEKKDFCQETLEALYTRLWSDVRHSQECATSYNLLQHYWELSATFDGLAFSLLLWFLLAPGIFFCTGPLGTGSVFYFKVFLYGAIIFMLLLCITVTIREACRYEKYQLQELVATVASLNTMKDKTPDQTKDTPKNQKENG